MLTKRIKTVLLLILVSLFLVVSLTGGEEAEKEVNPFEIIESFAEGIRRDYGKMPEDGSIPMRSAGGYDFKYCSNDRNRDGKNEASRFVILGVPKNPDSFSHVLYVDEGREVLYCRPLTAEHFDMFRAVKSEEIAWNVQENSFKKKGVSRCDALGFRFFPALSCRYDSKELRWKYFDKELRFGYDLALEIISYIRYVRFGRVDQHRRTGFYNGSYLAYICNSYSKYNLPDGDKYVYIALSPYWGEEAKAILLSWDGRRYEASISSAGDYDKLYEAAFEVTNFTEIEHDEGYRVNGIDFKPTGNYSIPTEKEYSKKIGDLLELRFDAILQDMLVLSEKENSKYYFWEAEKLDLGKYFPLEKLGYKYRFLSNDCNGDGISTATKFAFILYPTEEATEKRVLLKMERMMPKRFCYNISYLEDRIFELQSFDTKKLKLLSRIDSSYIDWDICQFAETPSRLDLLGLEFKKSESLPDWSKARIGDYIDIDFLEN